MVSVTWGLKQDKFNTVTVLCGTHGAYALCHLLELAGNLGTSGETPDFGETPDLSTIKIRTLDGLLLDREKGSADMDAYQSRESRLG